MQKNLNKLLTQLINLHPKYIDLSLNRLQGLLKKLNNPHLKLPPIIHIAGTNGKGSILSYIKYILIENKYHVHAYISPHLKNFNERIVLANKNISTKKLLSNLEYVKKINANQPITFFEITTAAAFLLFSKQKADFLILETGLGGRLDATNIIEKSLINIITPISLDHQEYLGNNIFKITDEKLGITKKQSDIIVAKQKIKIKNYIKKKLKKTKNHQIYYGEQFKILKKNKKNFSLEIKNKEYNFNNPSLLGEHQIENASVAISAILRLNDKGYVFKKIYINKGIKKTKWPGRLEKGKLLDIPVYLDGAHNEDAARNLLKYFRNKKIWIIFGMLKNKNILKFLKIIKPITYGIVAIPIPSEKNCFTTNKIYQVCQQLKINCIKKSSIRLANNYLLKHIEPKKILVCGSLYLIGKVRKKYL